MFRCPVISPLPFRPLILTGALLMLCLCSCSRVQSIRDAQQIVATADSLRSAGISLSPSTSYLTSHLSHFTSHISPLTSSDSIMLAEAVSALEPLRFFYPTAYAYANYYYGRLLREAGNQPEAMLAFLRVIHSRTKDYAIKGRAYSNMGTLCHWADEHKLSYQMYQECAQRFLLCSDFVMYFYALNAMAFELALQKLSKESLALTDIIEKECIDEGVLTKIWETRAQSYFECAKYDSTIYCVRKLQSLGNFDQTGNLLLARAYESLGITDSALYYAKRVFEESNFYGDKYNVLYILSHYDSTLKSDEILSLTSQREDLRFDEYEPEKVKLTQAVQLLEQDLTRKPNLTWLWATLATLCIIATSISIYIRKKKAKHQLISQQVEALQQTRDSLSAQTRQIENEQKLRQEKMLAEIELFCNSITEENMKKELCWIDFTQMCTIVNQRMFGLVDKLKARGITSMTEIRICVLLALDRFNAKQMANVVPCTYDSFKTTKSLIVKKLNVSRENIHSYLIKLAVGS